MPPSWLHRLSVDHSNNKHAALPDIEHADWTRSLNAGESSSASGGASTFAEGLLSSSNIALHGEICAMAVEPVLGYLVVGTTTGGLHLFGKESVQIDWSIRPANKIQHVLFKSGSPLLIVIDAKDNISIFDLSRNDPQIRTKVQASPHPFQTTQSTTSGAGPSGPLHPDTPMRIGAHTARNSVLCAEVSPLHNHLFMGLRDGTIDTYDLERLSPSSYRVPNLWWEEEEILRKSGVPDAPSRRHVPLIIDIKTHPTDVNQLLLAYEGGVVLLDVIKRSIVRTFQLRHLPGVPGSGAGDPNLMWTERAAPATCVAWRPDGLAFACGHEDGCISFWHVEDEEKPITVRTLESTDVDKPGMMNEAAMNDWPQSREPIFKLAWSGFPAQSWLGMAQHAASRGEEAKGAGAAGQEGEPATGTVLTVLGGATERHTPGLVCLHFPAFSWPAASYWNAKTPEALAKIRQALHASMIETKGSRYSTGSSVEDFILIPRDSPYYGLTYDPVAVITLLSPDPSLPPLPPPAAARGLKAFSFPPSSASEQKVSAHPTLHIQQPFAQRNLHLPLALSTAGSGAILGAKLVDVTPHVYRNLTAQADATANAEEQQSARRSSFIPQLPSSPPSASAAAVPHASQKHTLPLRGGRATPVASGTQADTAEAFATLARSNRWRLLITWHLDGTVRFHDASPQLLLIGHDQSPMVRSQDGSQAFTPGYLQKGFPSPLPHLTIETRSLISNASMAGHPLFDRLRADRAKVRIVDVHFAPEATEAAITLRAGQVFHYKFGFARYSQTDDLIEAVAEEVEQDEEMAAQMAHHQALSPSTSSAHTSPSTAELDRSMAGALHDLDIANTSSSTGPAPPRPRRDPKRMSVIHQSSASDNRRASDISSIHLMSPPQQQMAAHQPAYLDEITTVGHLASWRTDGFKPNIIVDLSRGEVTALAVSDIGFMAVACGPALAVIDLRGPHLIVREGFGGTGLEKESRSREERKMIEEESRSGVRHLHFTVCRTSATPVLSPTLVAVRESGFTTIWTMVKDHVDAWVGERAVGQQIDELHGSLNGVQIVDMAGNVSKAIPAELQRSVREYARGASTGSGGGEAPLSMDMNSMLCYGRQTITLRIGVSGAKIAKAEVSGNDLIRGASVIDRRGDKVLFVVTTKSFFLFALPNLQLIRRIQRHNRAHEERLSIAQATVSLDGSGDFVEVANSLDVCLWTVFATMPRPAPPALLLFTPPSMPLAPNMLGNVANTVANWLGGKSSGLSQGAQLDDVLAGGANKRAPMPKLPEQKYTQEKIDERERKDAVREEMGKRADETSYSTRAQFTRQAQAGGSSGVDGARQQANGAAGTAAWTFDLAKQRGEMVNSLEQGLSNLEKGASNWMKSAREDMIKQAAKDKLSKFF